MIRIAVVEDEETCIRRMEEYLVKYNETSGEELDWTVYRDGDQIMKAFRAQFDLIFMDIQMKFIDGMTAAEEIRCLDSEVEIVFVTNMAQYAVKGYEVGALDYIVKPISYPAFSQKLEKVIARIHKRKSSFLMIPVKGGILRQNTADIYYIESDGHYLIYHTADGERKAAGTMKAAEDVLSGKHFFKINKCFLVNLRHVDGIRDKCAVVRGERLPVSRPKMSAFMQELAVYWGN